MRGADYVVKRVVFALLTVFVAITINFALFRLADVFVLPSVSRLEARATTCRRGLSPFALITTKALSASPESAVANPRACATPAVSKMLSLVASPLDM